VGVQEGVFDGLLGASAGPLLRLQISTVPELSWGWYQKKAQVAPEAAGGCIINRGSRPAYK
jgi:hypothetical protein